MHYKLEIKKVIDVGNGEKITLAPQVSATAKKEKHDAEKHDAEKHDAEKHDAEKHDAEKHDAEKHDAEKHDAEKHGAEKHDAEKHDAEKHEGYYGIVYEGPHAMQRRWLQVLSREIIVTNPDGQQTHLGVIIDTSAGSYSSTTDPNHPIFNLDISATQHEKLSAKPETPYYADLYRVALDEEGEPKESKLTTDLVIGKGEVKKILPGSGIIDDNTSAMFDKPSWGAEASLSSLARRVCNRICEDSELKEKYYKKDTVVINKARIETYLVNTETQQPIFQVSLVATSKMRITNTFGLRYANYATEQPLSIDFKKLQPATEFQPEVVAAIRSAQDNNKFTNPFALPVQLTAEQKKDNDLQTSGDQKAEIQSEQHNEKSTERSQTRLLITMGVTSDAAKQKLSDSPKLEIPQDEAKEIDKSSETTPVESTVAKETKIIPQVETTSSNISKRDSGQTPDNQGSGITPGMDIK